MPRQFQDYEVVTRLAPSFEKVVRVPGTRVAWVNYVAMRRDFPALAARSNEEIDRLILANFAYVSESQLILSGKRNSPITADLGDKRRGLRPSSYVRADVMEFRDLDGTLLGLVDRKGAGSNVANAERNLREARIRTADELATMDHSDGLMSLGEAIVETTRERARRRLYQIESTGVETVESYFVLAFPFRILKDKGLSIPAGVYGRQAHIGRDMGSFKTPLPASERGTGQQDYFGAAVDQGMVRITDPRLAATFGAYAKTAIGPQQQADWAWAHETAAAFAAGGDRSSVEEHIRVMLSPLDGAGPDVPGTRGGSMTDEITGFLNRFARSEDPKRQLIAANTLWHLAMTPEVQAVTELLMTRPDAEVRGAAVMGLHRMSEANRRIWLRHFAEREPDLQVVGRLMHWYFGSWEERRDMVRIITEGLARRAGPDREKRAAMKAFVLVQSAAVFADLNMRRRLKEDIEAFFDRGVPFAPYRSGVRDCAEWLTPPPVPAPMPNAIPIRSAGSP